VVALYYSAMQHRMRTLYDNSIRDGLTHLLNRRGAIDAVTASLAGHAESYAALLIDIDGLKLINDMRGHVTGDAVIVCTAAAIREAVRESDIAARLGGDEFFLFAPDCGEQEATKIAERILAVLRKPSMPLAGIKISASIGIAVHEGSDVDFDRMYRDADAALHEARSTGKSRIGRFVPLAPEALAI
jgi:diguanylate cyclase (GGDEF)-like protein